MNAPTVKESDIVSYYDTCQIDYQLVWHLNSEKSLHYGYWFDHTRKLRKALQNMNEVVGKTAKIRENHHILDAGCGIGGTSIFLSQKYNCRVDGITLSGKQAEKATHLAKEYQLSDRLHFSVQDYCNTEFEDNTFDRIVAIESVCHANKKEDFLQEAYRLLKPGGKLVVTDFFRSRQKYSGKDEALILRWAKSWAVPDFEHFNSFAEKARHIGFTHVKDRDITDHIRPSARRLYYCFFPGYLVHCVLRIFKIRNLTHEANVWSTFLQYKALTKDLWSYHIIEITR